ncbi:LexA family protein [Streptomyces sp. CA-142005]|uniref:LexA family protein n=1 Tax=Streptomyces sp. CA-142005 TaxID=3240052 RepID=UPI003D94C6EC
MSRRKNDHLTDRHEKIIRFIRAYVADEGEYPTMARIGEAVGPRSRSSVHYTLQDMERLGAVVRGREGRRAVYRLTY